MVTKAGGRWGAYGVMCFLLVLWATSPQKHLNCKQGTYCAFLQNACSGKRLNYAEMYAPAEVPGVEETNYTNREAIWQTALTTLADTQKMHPVSL